MEYISIKEAAKRWGISARRVQTLCNEGKILGAEKWERSWMLPKDAEKPADGRTKAAAAADKAESGTARSLLPRRCPLLIMTDLYNGVRDTAERQNPTDAETLAEAWLCYGRGETERAFEILRSFRGMKFDFDTTVSVGILLSLCAMWRGDTPLWREAKKCLCGAPFSGENECETLRFWLAAADSAMYDVRGFPEWFTSGRFYTHLGGGALPAANFFYAKYLFVLAKGMELKRFEMPEISGFGLMRMFTYIAEPMIANTAGKNDVLEIYLRLLCASAYHDIGEDAEAVYHIDAALKPILAGGLLGILAEHVRQLDTLVYDRLALIEPSSVRKLKKLNERLIEGYTKLHNELYQSSLTTIFSPREFETAKLAAFGLSNKEIAARLNIAVSSVKSLIAMAKNKVGADNRRDLGLYI